MRVRYRALAAGYLDEEAEELALQRFLDDVTDYVMETSGVTELIVGRATQEMLYDTPAEPITVEQVKALFERNYSNDTTH